MFIFYFLLSLRVWLQMVFPEQKGGACVSFFGQNGALRHDIWFAFNPWTFGCWNEFICSPLIYLFFFYAMTSVPCWHVSSIHARVFVTSLRIKFTHLSVAKPVMRRFRCNSFFSAAYKLFASVHLLPAPDHIQLTAISLVRKSSQWKLSQVGCNLDYFFLQIFHSSSKMWRLKTKQNVSISFFFLRVGYQETFLSCILKSWYIKVKATHSRKPWKKKFPKALRKANTVI